MFCNQLLKNDKISFNEDKIEFYSHEDMMDFLAQQVKILEEKKIVEENVTDLENQIRENLLNFKKRISDILNE